MEDRKGIKRAKLEFDEIVKVSLEREIDVID